MVNEAARLLFTRRQPLFTQNQRFSSHLHQFQEALLVKSFHYAVASLHLWSRSFHSLVKLPPVGGRMCYLYSAALPLNFFYLKTHCGRAFIKRHFWFRLGKPVAQQMDWHANPEGRQESDTFGRWVLSYVNSGLLNLKRHKFSAKLRQTKIWQNHFFKNQFSSVQTIEKKPLFWKIMGYLWKIIFFFFSGLDFLKKSC